MLAGGVCRPSPDVPQGEIHETAMIALLIVQQNHDRYGWLSIASPAARGTRRTCANDNDAAKTTATASLIGRTKVQTQRELHQIVAPRYLGFDSP